MQEKSPGKPKNHPKKWPVQATEPEYARLEMELFRAAEKMGWKSLTAFVVGWAKREQPKDYEYSIPFWVRELYGEKELKS